MKTLLAIALGVISLTGMNSALTQAQNSTSNSQNPSMSVTNSSSASTEWRLVEIAGSPVPNNIQITLRIDGNRLGGRACNHYGAEIQTVGDRPSNAQAPFTISAIAATRMACAPAMMEQENRYFQRLQNARSISMQSESSLTIYTGEDEAPLRFSRLNANGIQTLTFFEGRRNAVRVYVQDGETRMNVYDKRDRLTWMCGVPVAAQQTPEGTEYTNLNGEVRLVVFVPNSGEAPTLSIDGAIDR